MTEQLAFNPNSLVTIYRTSLENQKEVRIEIIPLMGMFKDIKNIDRDRDYNFELYRVSKECEGKLQEMYYYMLFRRPNNHVVAKEYAQEDMCYGLDVRWRVNKSGKLVLTSGKYSFELFGADPKNLLSDPLLVEVIKEDLKINNLV